MLVGQHSPASSYCMESLNAAAAALATWQMLAVLHEGKQEPPCLPNCTHVMSYPKAEVHLQGLEMPLPSWLRSSQEK